MKKTIAAASCAALLLTVPAQAGFRTIAQDQSASSDTAAAETPECKPKKKKKKGLGLGGVLRAARNSGLVSSVASRVGSNTNYIASSAIVTAVDAAATPAGAPAPQETSEGTTC